MFYWLLGVLAVGSLLLRHILERVRRRRRMRVGLPEALDLMWIYTKAGLPLDKTMAEVSKDLCYFHPDLSEELYLASREMRAGTPWDEALCNLAERTGMDEIKALTGTGLLGIVQALRAQSDSLHIQHRQRLKWVPVLSVFVLVVFLLPSLLFVILGPAMIQSIRALMPEAGPVIFR